MPNERLGASESVIAVLKNARGKQTIDSRWPWWRRTIWKLFRR